VLQTCRHPQTKSGDEVLCRMPVVSLPDELREELENSESGTINSTQGPGVAVYESSDGRTRVDIYVGFNLDGIRRYRNISSVKPNIKMQFALPPSISCKSDDTFFNPNKDRIISFQVIFWLLLHSNC